MPKAKGRMSVSWHGGVVDLGFWITYDESLLVQMLW